MTLLIHEELTDRILRSAVAVHRALGPGLTEYSYQAALELEMLENHSPAVALYFMYYNFGRVHQTLRVTPAMAAGVSDHVWEIDEIVALLSSGLQGLSVRR